MKKHLAGILSVLMILSMAFTICASADETVRKTGYVQVGKNHYYYYENGEMARNKWVNVDGVMHWFKSNGREIKPKKYIAFTFDDGPTANTQKILNILKKYDSTATFFQVGYMISSQSSVEKKIWKQGSEIGIHSWDHPQLSALSSGGIVTQLSRCANEIRKYSGKKPKLMRPPYGAVNANVRASSGYPLIMWSITDEGLYQRSWQMTANAILRNPQNGDIALMHDLQNYSVQVCEYAIPRLIQKGFKVVSVSNLAKMRNVTLRNGTTYSRIA